MRITAPALLMWVAWLVTGARSDSPLDTRTCDDIITDFYNQTDIDFYSTCPVIAQGEDIIEDSFSGPFELPGVQSMGSVVAGYFGPKITGDNRTDPLVTSVSLPDLTNTTFHWGVSLGYIDALTDFSFPKLQTIEGNLNIMGNPNVKTVSFPALETVTGAVLLWGVFEEISFPSLKRAGYINVQLTNDNPLDCRALGANFSSIAYMPKAGDAYVGFTCTTYKEGDSYSSPTNSTSSSTTTSSSTSPTTPVETSTSGTGSTASSTGTSPSGSTKPSEAESLMKYKSGSVVLGSVAVALFILL